MQKVNIFHCYFPFKHGKINSKQHLKGDLQMKFAELPYSRPDIGAVCEKISLLTAKLEGAESAEAQLGIIKEKEELLSDFSTQATIASIRHTVDTRDEFYEKVKRMLLEEGEVSDAIGRLTDKEYYNTLGYEEKQRYNLALSEKYLRALERFRREYKFEYMEK